MLGSLLALYSRTLHAKSDDQHLKEDIHDVIAKYDVVVSII